MTLIRHAILALTSSVFLFACNAAASDPPVAIAVHGGAGTIKRADLTETMEREYRVKLAEAARAGHDILERGGTSLDAVQAAILILEDSPLFNAGKGAVFNHDGVNELDAAIMDGANLNAGAVAGLKRVRNPILAARAVMEQSPHVLLFGEGAEIFAQQQGVEMVDPGYYFTERRWTQLEKARNRETTDKRPATANEPGGETQTEQLFSTVGAVALDQAGNLAAGTSTGGMTNKRYGRVGDVPIIGAGTYADNQSCAVSATGHGEYFIRSVVAYDICAQMRYRGFTLEQSAENVVMEKLVEFGGEGGIIAVDAKGNLSLKFNSLGMYRAFIDTKGELFVGIHQN